MLGRKAPKYVRSARLHNRTPQKLMVTVTYDHDGSATKETLEARPNASLELPEKLTVSGLATFVMPIVKVTVTNEAGESTTMQAPFPSVNTVVKNYPLSAEVSSGSLRIVCDLP